MFNMRIQYIHDNMKLLGAPILHSVDYLKRKRGSDGVELIFQNLEFRLEDIQPLGWYPFEWYVKLLDEITKVLNKKGYTVAARIGYDRSKRVSFLNDVKEDKTPRWVMGRVQNNWPAFFNAGRVELTSGSDNEINLSILDFESHPLFCERQNGLLKGLIREVCGLKEATIEESKCTCNGDDCCSYDLKW